jgi:Sensors of blue-light using FAD
MTQHHPALSDEPRSGLRAPALYNLVYCSRASAEVDAAAVDRIIASARRHNPAGGITGMLVFGSGVFFQWLEGPRDNVMQLMNTIRADPRHETVVLLSETEEVRERLFPDWDMEHVGTDHIRDVLLDAQENAKDSHNAAALAALIKHLDGGALSGLGAA